MKKEVVYDELLEVIPNKYILTILGGKRVRELAKGAPCKLKFNAKDTNVRKALLEIEEGKLKYENEENI